MRPALPRVPALVLAVALTALGAVPAHAQPAPPPLAAAGVDEQIGARVPLDVTFTAARTGPLALRDLVDGTRPVLLVLAYARCRMLCSLVLRGVADVARRMPLVPGDDYRLVLVGLDPRETADEATRMQAALLDRLGGGDDPRRWPYLVGERASIDAVAGALGFHYAWDERTEQYAHPAVIFVLTPDGRIARYLHGVQFAPDEVAGALADAAAGRTPSPSSAAAEVMRCFRFDPATRRAGARAERLLQAGAALSFLLLFAGIAGLIVWERLRARRAP